MLSICLFFFICQDLKIKDLPVRESVAKAHLDAGRYKQAIEHYNRLAYDAGDETYLFWVGWAQYCAGELDKSENTLEYILKGDPKQRMRAACLYTLGQINSEQQEFEKARVHFKDSIAIYNEWRAKLQKQQKTTTDPTKKRKIKKNLEKANQHLFDSWTGIAEVSAKSFKVDLAKQAITSSFTALQELDKPNRQYFLLVKSLVQTAGQHYNSALEFSIDREKLFLKPSPEQLFDIKISTAYFAILAEKPTIAERSLKTAIGAENQNTLVHRRKLVEAMINFHLKGEPINFKYFNSYLKSDPDFKWFIKVAKRWSKK